MKLKFTYGLCILVVLLMLTACQNNESTETQEIQIISETCEIVESAEAFCDKPVKAGIYSDYSEWKKSINGTDVSAVLEKKDLYDEVFFEDKALIYIVDCSSGNSQCEYEGYKIEEVDGKKILSIQMSYSTDKLLNKLHAYHVFFVLDRSEAEKIDEAELSVFARD